MPATYLETLSVPLADLTPYPGNAKKGNLREIRASVRRHGQYRALIVRRHDDQLTVLAGNNTLQALKDEKIPTARVEVIECTDEEARRINLADNRLSEIGEYDMKALAALVAEIDDDLTGLGYNDQDIDGILRAGDFYGEQANDFLSDMLEPDRPPAPIAAPAPDAEEPGEQRVELPVPDSPRDGSGPASGQQGPSFTPSGETPADPWRHADPPPGTSPGSPDTAQSAPTGSSGPTAGPPPPARQVYTVLSWTCDEDQKITIRTALSKAQARFGVQRSVDALTAICQRFLDGGDDS